MLNISNPESVKELILFDLTSSIKKLEIKDGSVDFCNLDNGIYFVRLNLTNGVSMIKKLVLLK